MGEYIEREALLKDISESVVFTVRGDSPSLEIRGANKVIDRIKSAPTADVVEAVRCKDCKHYIWGRCDEISYIMDGYYQGTFEIKKPTDFCSYGVRKEGAESG